MDAVLGLILKMVAKDEECAETRGGKKVVEMWI